MKKTSRIFYCLIFIAFGFSQRNEDQAFLNDLNDAIHFAYQNNLNVLIEDFTGVG